MAKTTKPTPAMEELLDAMRNGVRVHFMRGLHTYYFRSDTMKHCTAQVMGLRERGLLKMVGYGDVELPRDPTTREPRHD